MQGFEDATPTVAFVVRDAEFNGGAGELARASPHGLKRQLNDDC